MKRYDIEVIHEPSGAYLNYSIETDESNPDFYNYFINDISLIVINEEDLDV